MGKYMRKAKITGEVAVMELTQSSLGVRTRAKTLALQRLENMPTASTAATSSGTSYLQLRSRRLEKPCIVISNNESKKQQQQQPKESTCKQKANPNPRMNSRLVVSSENSASVGSISQSCSKNVDNLSNNEAMVGLEKEKDNRENCNDLGIEASFGENFLEFEGKDRSTRETTPCSLIQDSETVGTPGSTTRPTNSVSTNRRVQSNTTQRNVPTAHEMEEFFAGSEQQQQRVLTEKYNFDPVTDSPLPGRYEWVKLDL